MDHSGPVEVLPPPKAGDKHGAKLVYANGVTVEHNGRLRRRFLRQRRRGPGQPRQVHLQARQRDDCRLYRQQRPQDTPAQAAGAEGRAGLPQRREDPALRQQEPPQRLPRSASKTRKKPITSEQVGARSAICCHLMNQVYYHGAEDPLGPGEAGIRRRHRRPASGSPATTAARGAFRHFTRSCAAAGDRASSCGMESSAARGSPRNTPRTISNWSAGGVARSMKRNFRPRNSQPPPPLPSSHSWRIDVAQSLGQIQSMGKKNYRMHPSSSIFPASLPARDYSRFFFSCLAELTIGNRELTTWYTMS